MTIHGQAKIFDCASAALSYTRFPPCFVSQALTRYKLEGLEVTRDEQRVFKLLSSGDQKFKRSLKKDWISTPGWLNRLKYIRDMLLPSTSYVAAKYNISRPWMALLFYPYRWCLILLKLLTS